MCSEKKTDVDKQTQQDNYTAISCSYILEITVYITGLCAFTFPF